MRASELIVARLGLATDSLDHPMWQDVHVVNGMEWASVHMDGKLLWRGIVAADRARALDELQAMEFLDVARAPLKL
jgi:hypothetical protein